MTIVTHRTNCQVKQNHQEPAHTIRARFDHSEDHPETNCIDIDTCGAFCLYRRNVGVRIVFCVQGSGQ